MPAGACLPAAAAHLVQCQSSPHLAGQSPVAVLGTSPPGKDRILVDAFSQMCQNLNFEMSS